MTNVALAESYHEQPAKPGLFPIADNALPSGWGPSPGAISAPAYPTPFARAEATRQVLAVMDTQELGGERPHELAMRFRQLVLATLAGILELQVFDVADRLRFDNFGRALLTADPEARYLVALVEHTAPGAAAGQIFGYSHPDCLFWPHSRRSDADWTRLQNRVGTKESEVLLLLRQWQHALETGGLWNESSDLLPWQRGVAHLTQNVPLQAELTRLHEDSRFMGPIMLRAPVADGSRAVVPIYFPMRRDGFARDFVRRCELTPVIQGRDIALAAGDAVHVRIAFPELRADAGRIELGTGVVGLLDAGPLPPAAGRYCFEDRGDVPGLPKLLGTLTQALTQRDRSLERSAVERCPVLYPDPIRILVHRNLWRTGDSRDPAPTENCLRRIIRTSSERSPQLPTAAAEGAVVVLFGRDALLQRRMLFLDAYQGHSIGDLSTLGMCLYLAFTGQARVVGDSLRDLDDVALTQSSALRPLEATQGAYDRLESERARASKRLATLQRMVASYRSQDVSARELSADRLLSVAAKSFADYASDRSVLASGRRASASVQLELQTGEKLSVLFDSLAGEAV